ncbi:MAG: glycosyltransferase family 2 protein [Lentisphaerae bacterium]|nr:glycosyltransferase family 2 protein [Lentisphaerota bacterium]
MDADHTISIIVPALNEEARLELAVDTACRAAARQFNDYEVLVFNDGSSDGTGQVAERLAQSNPHVRVFHNARPQGLGGVIRAGVQQARMHYVIRVNGSGTELDAMLERIFSLAGSADLIIPYVEDMSARPWHRRWLSGAFQRVLNGVFRLNLRYYNQSILCRTALARGIPVRTNSHAFPAEFVIKALKAGHSYREVGIASLSEATGSPTKAFRLRNVMGVLGFLSRIVWEVYGPARRDR